MKKILQSIENGKANGQKLLALLLDPDKCVDDNSLSEVLQYAEEGKVDYIFVGGSLITDGNFGKTISAVKQKTSLPVVIFPGNGNQVDSSADSILLLSVISGRNPDLLIGQHVQSSYNLKLSGIEIIPTGYVLIESENLTTAVYMSQSLPVPRTKPDIAAATALAGEQLGLRIIYLDGGSGASGPIPENIIRKVRSVLDVPIIAGGGIQSSEEAEKMWMAGANLVVIGSAAEKDPSILKKFKSR